MRARYGIPALALACLLSACGGSSSTDEAEPLPDLHGQSVTVAVETSSPPFSFIDAGNQGFGWDYDTLREICRRLNCVAHFEQTAFQGVFEAVHDGLFDLLADGVTITAEREQLVDFSIPYASVSEVLLVRASELETLELFKIDLTRPVGAQTGTTNEATALDTFGSARVRTRPTEPQVVSALLTGEFDGVVVDSVAANAFVSGNPGQLKILGSLTAAKPLAFAFPPDSDLIDAVNAALQEMIDDGSLRVLNLRWGLTS